MKKTHLALYNINFIMMKKTYIILHNNIIKFLTFSCHLSQMREYPTAMLVSMKTLILIIH